MPRLRIIVMKPPMCLCLFCCVELSEQVIPIRSVITATGPEHITSLLATKNHESTSANSSLLQAACLLFVPNVPFVVHVCALFDVSDEPPSAICGPLAPIQYPRRLAVFEKIAATCGSILNRSLLISMDLWIFPLAMRSVAAFQSKNISTKSKRSIPATPSG